jgi:predicted dehydrogenase
MTGALAIGVIGAGRIAEKHLEVLAALEDVRIAGIASRRRDPAERLAARFGAGCVAADLDELCARAAPDALLVLVSAASMRAVGLEALRRGLPCFLEKPAGLAPEETLELAQAAARSGAPSMVGYNRRFYSVFHAGLERLRRHGGVLGIAVEGHERIGAVRAAGRHPPQVLDAWIFANATHTIDLLRLFGGEIAELHPLAARVREPRGDQFAAAMRFAGGALGTYQAHWLSPAGWRVALFGDGIEVEFEPLESGRWRGADGAGGAIEPSAEDARFKPGFYGQMRAFCALARGAPTAWPAADLAEAHRTMLLAQSLCAGLAPRAPGERRP